MNYLEHGLYCNINITDRKRNLSYPPIGGRRAKLRQSIAISREPRLDASEQWFLFPNRRKLSLVPQDREAGAQKL
jgi:hypothetical protein